MMRKREQPATVSLNQAHPLNQAVFGAILQQERKGLSRLAATDKVLKAMMRHSLRRGIRDGWTAKEVRDYRESMRRIFAS